MNPFIRKAILFLTLVSITHFIQGQKTLGSDAIVSVSSASKPYKVLTNGNQITIESKQNLKSLMVWSSSGHRIVEEKELKTTSYSFYVPAKEKICFISIETMEGKRFSEKIGVK